ncbi:MAG: ribosomal RNA small subunit methyltransferase A [Deltaproteobacteria bacterium]|nr:ribosomal RNA small subunit methyltransferase A [Deltaproteobacteria bacterium]
MFPKKSMGQNFLSDLESARKVVEAGGIGPGTAVLEIGPGRGFLTRFLVDAGARITAVEKDRELAAFLPGMFPDHPLQVLEADFLELDLAPLAAGRPVVVGNLPYYAAMPILMKVLEHADAWPRMVFMFQLEVARRLTAAPGTGEYGVPTAIVALTHAASIVRRIPPGAFFPRPKVESALVRFDPLPEPLLPDRADRTAFGDFVAASFRFRRKKGSNALALGTGLDAAAAARHLEQLGLDLNVRLEELPPGTLVRLWRSLAKAG